MSEPGDEMDSDEMDGVAMDCTGLAGVAADLALGVLTGRERAQAIAHLDQCDDCREDVRQLMATSDGLLTLLPAREPSPGFESRVLDRLGLSVPASSPPVSRVLDSGNARSAHFRHAAPRRAPGGPGTQGPRAQGAGTQGGTQGLGAPGARGALRGRRLIAAAVIALAVFGGGVAGWGISTVAASRTGPSIADEAPMNSAVLLTPSGQKAGQVFVYQGSKAEGGQWMYMMADLPSGDGTVTCQLVSTDGQVTTVGSFRLVNGYGSWGSSGPWGAGTVHTARLLAADGVLLATATFAAAYGG